MRSAVSSSWLDSLLKTVSQRGREMVRNSRTISAKAAVALKRSDVVEDLLATCAELLSESGEACGTALAEDVVERLAAFEEDQRLSFFTALANRFGPDRDRVASCYQAWNTESSPKTRSALMNAIEGQRQRLFRRMNMAPGGTRALVGLREELIAATARDSSLQEVENDLRHLLVSWFNRGFLEFQTINWETPADILEKLIAYEAVHQVSGWDDLRRRLAPDRRCYAFFHPALPREPLIFVEVALQQGIAAAVGPILEAPIVSAATADTALFYSISNCQRGLRGINFGSFLIKQVVDELQRENPKLRHFSTLSPIPTFREWLTNIEGDMLGASLGRHIEILRCLSGAGTDLLPRNFLIQAADQDDVDPAVSNLLTRMCAYFLCELTEGPVDPVARFHLGNGARLERINIGADLSAKGRKQSFGLMANYLYEPDEIVRNHIRFASQRQIARSESISALLNSDNERLAMPRVIAR